MVLNEFVQKKISKYSWFLALSLGSVLLLLLISFEFFSLRKNMNEKLLAMERNFIYWTQVGDQFQMRRAIENISKSTSSDFLIVKGNSFELSPEVFKSTQLRELKDDISYLSGKVFFSMEKDLKISSGKSITLKLYSGISLLFLIGIFFTGIILTQALTWIFRRKLQVVLSDLSIPFKNLACYMDKIGTQETEDFQEYGIYEFDKIQAKALEASRRIAEQKSLISQNEKLKAQQEIALQLGHDIKSPIASLEVAMENLKEVDPTIKELLELSLERIKDISSNLYLKSKDAIMRNKTVFNIADCLKKILLQKQSEYPNSKIILNLNSSECSLINKEHFQRIISNLINNSIEARANEVKINLKDKEGKLILTVNDNGLGVPNSVIEKIFNKGFSYGKKNGMGIGLSHARKIIESWDGKIFAKSNSAKKGTTFEIELPICRIHKESKLLRKQSRARSY